MLYFCLISDPPLIIELVLPGQVNSATPGHSQLDSTKDNNIGTITELDKDDQTAYNLDVSHLWSDGIPTIETIHAEDYVCSVVLYKGDQQMASTFLKPLTEIPDRTSKHISRSPTKQPFQSVQLYQTLLGPTYVSGEILRDHCSNLGVFFVFSELSIRFTGSFKLEASVIHVPRYH
jgi:hypothetical protein